MNKANTEKRRKMRIMMPSLLAVPIAACLLYAVPSIAYGQTGPKAGQSQTDRLQSADVSAPVPDFPSVKRTYVSFGLGVYGLMYEPVTPAGKSHIGIFIMHYLADYTNFPACAELSKRGYTVLCAKNSGGNLDRVLLDAKSGVAYLRNYPGIRDVILFGHAGGASLLTAYELIAENGAKACQDSAKIIKCPDTLTGFPKADGMVLADTELGVAESMLTSIDPAVVDEGSGMKINPELDAFNPKNGFDPNGSSDYSKEFLDRFQRAVARRNNQLIDSALARLAAIEAGKGHFADDEAFTVPGAGSTIPNHKIIPNDLRLMSHTKKAWPLLHADGSMTTEIVHSVRVPEIRNSFTSSFDIGAVNTTVRTFLIDHAIRVTDDFGIDEDSVHGVIWKSSYSSAVGNIESIKVPLLVMGMTGTTAYLAGEVTYEHAKSPDKSLVFVEGASHTYETCKKCEKYPGQFGDTTKIVFDYIDQWLSHDGRFTAGQP